jgi:hypothetical protein
VHEVLESFRLSCLPPGEAIAAAAPAGPATFYPWNDSWMDTLCAPGATDSTLALEWVVQGTHDRTSPALPATNLPFSIRGATIARVADGRITYNRDYWDMAGFLQQVGVLPAA